MTQHEWERLPGESARAFHAFTHYRDTPPHLRSIEFASASHKTQCLEPHQGGTSPVPSQWKRWSSSYSWVQRTSAYDRHRDSLLRAAKERMLVESPERWAESARTMQERALDAFSERDLSSESIRELRLLIVEGMRMEREAFQFGFSGGSTDSQDAIRAFLDAVRPSPEEVAAVFEGEDARSSLPDD